MTVHVTRREIAAGCRTSTGTCPVALAIRAHVRPSVNVVVWPESVEFHTTDRARSGRRAAVYHRELPIAVTAWIHAFDSGRPAVPFAFELDVPAEALA